jgi:hypothetical protein
MSGARFQHLWHQFVIRVDDGALAETWLEALGARSYRFEAETRTEFSVRRRSDGTFDLSDGPDVFAVGATRTAVPGLIVERSSRRALELASRKGWVCFHGMVSRSGGRSALCLGARSDVTAGAPIILAKKGRILEVPRLQPVQPGSALAPCGPGGVGGSEDVVALVRVTVGDEMRVEPIGSLEAVLALLSNGIELTESPVERTRTAAALARSAPGYAVRTPTWPPLPAMVWECLGTGPSDR